MLISATKQDLLAVNASRSSVFAPATRTDWILSCAAKMKLHRLESTDERGRTRTISKRQSIYCLFRLRPPLSCPVLCMSWKKQMHYTSSSPPSFCMDEMPRLTGGFLSFYHSSSTVCRQSPLCRCVSLRRLTLHLVCGSAKGMEPNVTHFRLMQKLWKPREWRYKTPSSACQMRL